MRFVNKIADRLASAVTKGVTAGACVSDVGQPCGCTPYYQKNITCKGACVNTYYNRCG